MEFGCVVLFLFVFFSSRRRHTRCLSDWSSDVCSSDLVMSQCSTTTFGSCGLMVGEIIVPPPPGPIMVQGSNRGAGPGLAAASMIAGSVKARTTRGKQRTRTGRPLGSTGSAFRAIGSPETSFVLSPQKKANTIFCDRIPRRMLDIGRSENFLLQIGSGSSFRAIGSPETSFVLSPQKKANTIFCDRIPRRMLDIGRSENFLLLSIA